MLDYETLDQAKDDAGLPSQIASGYFAVLSGKMFGFREKEEGDDKVRFPTSFACCVHAECQALLLGHLQGYLPLCRTAVERAIESGAKGSTLAQMEKMIDVFHVELCCEDQDWEDLETFTQVCPETPETPQSLISSASHHVGVIARPYRDIGDDRGYRFAIFNLPFGS